MVLAYWEFNLNKHTDQLKHFQHRKFGLLASERNSQSRQKLTFQETELFRYKH